MANTPTHTHIHTYEMLDIIWKILWYDESGAADYIYFAAAICLWHLY